MRLLFKDSVHLGYFDEPSKTIIYFANELAKNK